MRISAIKKELDQRGVGYRGLLEKSEFVDLLVDARAKGTTAPPSAGGDDGGGEEGGAAAAGAPGGGGAGAKKDEFDPSYKEVEVRKSVSVRSAERGCFGFSFPPEREKAIKDICRTASGLGGIGLRPVLAFSTKQPSLN